MPYPFLRRDTPNCRIHDIFEERETPKVRTDDRGSMSARAVLRPISPFPPSPPPPFLSLASFMSVGAWAHLPRPPCFQRVGLQYPQGLSRGTILSMTGCTPSYCLETLSVDGGNLPDNLRCEREPYPQTVRCPGPRAASQTCSFPLPPTKMAKLSVRLERDLWAYLST